MGHGPNIEAVVTGALRDLPAFEAVFEEVLDDLARDNAKLAEDAERWRVIDDGECDYGFEEYWTSGIDDDGYASGIIADLYIKAVRAAGNWKALAEHNRVSEFGYYWARAIQNTDAATPPSPEELRAMFAAAKQAE
ncbi:MAG: hypothetical protein IPP02_16275 [Chitinophagaceae bacterium]|nr:hypothetical protein [Chitinophagaceae bacterium]